MASSDLCWIIIIPHTKSFFSEKIKKPCHPVLRWWSDNERSLLRLSILARWVLGIPAGSAASEQLFSIAGLFDTARRGQLNTETFELLTLQKVNQDILETEDISDSSEDENSENDPDRVGILEESASDLSDSDGEDEEQFLDCFEEGSDISTEGSAAEELEDDE